MHFPRRQLAVAAVVLALLVVVPVLSADVRPGATHSEAASRKGPTRLSLFPERLSNGTMIIHARGPVAEGDAARIEELAQAAKAAELWLDSPGGSATEGMRIGRAVRSLGLVTRVDERVVCASACVDAFLGGTRRFVAELGTLGVHRPTLTGGPGWRKRFDEAVRKEGLESTVRKLEATAMLLAHEHAAFLREIGIAPELGAIAFGTPNAELRHLTRKELRDWRLVTGEWDSQADETLTTAKRMRRIINRGLEEDRRRALEELPRAEEMQREAEAMLRSTDPERRRAGEALMRQVASIRRRAGETPHRSPGGD